MSYDAVVLGKQRHGHLKSTNPHLDRNMKPSALTTKHLCTVELHVSANARNAAQNTVDGKGKCQHLVFRTSTAPIQCVGWAGSSSRIPVFPLSSM